MVHCKEKRLEIGIYNLSIDNLKVERYLYKEKKSKPTIRLSILKKFSTFFLYSVPLISYAPRQFLVSFANEINNKKSIAQMPSYDAERKALNQ